MRSSPTFSDTKLSLSFFLTTPARKPRTECCCQSVAFMMAVIVAPFGWRSMPRTISCFETERLPVGADVVAARDTDLEGWTFARGRARVADFLLREVLAGFAFLLVA